MKKELHVTVDFDDDTFSRKCEPPHVDRKPEYFASLGVNRLDWIWDTWNLLYREPFGGEKNPLAYAVKKARALGMAVHALIKPFETGFSHVPHTFPQPAGMKIWRNLNGAFSLWRDPFIVDHRDKCFKRRPGPADPGGAVRTVKLVKAGAEPTRVKKEHLEIWTGELNGRLEPYRGAFTFSSGIEKRVAFRPDQARMVQRQVRWCEERDCLVLTLGGLSIPEHHRYIDVRCSLADGPGDFWNTQNELVEIYNGAGERIPSSPGCQNPNRFGGGMNEVTLQYSEYGLYPEVREFFRDPEKLRQASRDDYFFPPYAPEHLDGGTACVARGFDEYMPILNPVYPEVRDYWLGVVDNCIESGAAGVNIRAASHSCYNAQGYEYRMTHRKMNMEKTMNGTTRSNRRVILGWFFFVLLLTAQGLLSATAFAKPELVLVDQGKSLAPIIVFSNAPPFTRKAADELAAYIEKVGGVRPQVIEGLPDPVPARAIWVGFQPKLKELFPKTDFDFKNPEEILIAANGNHLVIAGRDRWDPQHMVVKAARPAGRPIEGWQQEFGTVNAVCTFIQDYLDVRWLWPGEIGEDIIKKDKIAFAPFEYRYHPLIRSRFSVLCWACLGDARCAPACLDWSRLQRIELDSSNLMYRGIPSGHWTLDWKQLHETHPEYFALQPDGTRGWPDYVKLCKSNPALWDKWLEDVGEQLKEDPTRTLFDGAVNDGCLAGYCVCPNCKAWDAPEADKRFLVWNGCSTNYVALSDRQTRFANNLARKLRERYPDKDYKVVMLAYGPSLPAPLKNKPDDNVIVLFCSNWFAEMGAKDKYSQVGTKWSQEFADWAATGAKNLWWRPNMPGLGYGLPDVPFGRVMESLRHIVKNNCTGICLSVFENSWPTQGPLYYMLAQLAWNPDRDGYKILDDYYQRGFGQAAGQLKAYWTLMEETRNRKVDGDLAYWKAYDEAFFKRAASLLDEADAVLAKQPEIYRKRMAHMRLGLDYTRLMIETIELKAQYAASKKQDVKIADRLRENLKKLSNIVAAQSTNYMRISPGIQQNWLDPKKL